MTRLRQPTSPTVLLFRQPDGRFAATAPAQPACTVAKARRIYLAYLASVCTHQGLDPAEVAAQLARPGRPNFDAAWRAATYARQLALYLANTSHDVPQIRLAEVAGLTKAAVSMALRAIEDLRDVPAYDQRVDLVAAEFGVTA